MSKYQWRIDRMAGETAADREARKARYQLTARQVPLLADAGVTLLAGGDSAALNTYVYPAQVDSVRHVESCTGPGQTTNIL